ncbi:hypothetical protein LCGC14_2827740 [marine sediment metagenome]|uniref:Uncharacterized protein n=1 Tax=marine sediment metagenome TaxID=412755 RepID=A0A0F9ANI1_9ZZZZ
MAKEKYLVSDIAWDTDEEWDTDGEDVDDLPTSVVVVVDSEDYCDSEELGDLLGEVMSDDCGWCHDGFSYDRLLDQIIEGITVKAARDLFNSVPPDFPVKAFNANGNDHLFTAKEMWLSITHVDDDKIFVFHTADGWIAPIEQIMVCENSITIYTSEVISQE